jgi:hypothetical protein
VRVAIQSKDRFEVLSYRLVVTEGCEAMPQRVRHCGSVGALNAYNRTGQRATLLVDNHQDGDDSASARLTITSVRMMFRMYFPFPLPKSPCSHPVSKTLRVPEDPLSIRNPVAVRIEGAVAYRCQPRPC